MGEPDVLPLEQSALTDNVAARVGSPVLTPISSLGLSDADPDAMFHPIDHEIDNIDHEIDAMFDMIIQIPEDVDVPDPVFEAAGSSLGPNPIPSTPDSFNPIPLAPSSPSTPIPLPVPSSPPTDSVPAPNPGSRPVSPAPSSLPSNPTSSLNSSAPGDPSTVASDPFADPTSSLGSSAPSDPTVSSDPSAHPNLSAQMSQLEVMHTGPFLREKSQRLGPVYIDFRNWRPVHAGMPVRHHSQADVGALCDAIKLEEHAAFSPVHLQLDAGATDVWEGLKGTAPWSQVTFSADKSLGTVMHGQKRRMAMLELFTSRPETFPQPGWWGYIYPPCQLFLSYTCFDTDNITVFSDSHAVAISYWLNAENSAVGRTETQASDVLVLGHNFIQEYRKIADPDRSFIKKVWKNLVSLPVRQGRNQYRQLRGVNAVMGHDGVAGHILTLMDAPMFRDGIIPTVFEEFVAKLDMTVSLFPTGITNIH